MVVPARSDRKAGYFAQKERHFGLCAAAGSIGRREIVNNFGHVRLVYGSAIDLYHLGHLGEPEIPLRFHVLGLDRDLIR